MSAESARPCRLTFPLWTRFHAQMWYTTANDLQKRENCQLRAFDVSVCSLSFACASGGISLRAMIQTQGALLQETNGSLLPEVISNSMDSSVALEPQGFFCALCCPHPSKTPPLLIKPSKTKSLFCWPSNNVLIFSFSLHRKDEKEYALKQIEGTGISMSACREIAVSDGFH